MIGKFLYKFDDFFDKLDDWFDDLEYKIERFLSK